MPITEAIKYTCFQQDTETDQCSQPPCTAACVNSCRELVDGNYQSCQTCEGYVSCIDKELYSRSCPGQLVWDDRERKCAEFSTTCSHLTTQSEVMSAEAQKFPDHDINEYFLNGMHED
uniref:Chitin-binding type-2 domain-containing protein n=1 Tax=Magallana gigas TaxID=29159 RepID=A0A8W8ILH2_MAGGI